LAAKLGIASEKLAHSAHYAVNAAGSASENVRDMFQNRHESQCRTIWEPIRASAKRKQRPDLVRRSACVKGESWCATLWGRACATHVTRGRIAHTTCISWRSSIRGGCAGVRRSSRRRRCIINTLRRRRVRITASGKAQEGNASHEASKHFLHHTSPFTRSPRLSSCRDENALRWRQFHNIG